MTTRAKLPDRVKRRRQGALARLIVLRDAYKAGETVPPRILHEIAVLQAKV